jgi:hypothetical protein
MGNKIAAELIDAIRLSTFGTTLCSRTVNATPVMTEINNFSGVAKAMVRFSGDTTSIVGDPCPLLRSYNIGSVEYLGVGSYKIIFNSNFYNFNLGTNYIISGSVQSNTLHLTAANTFTVINAPNNQGVTFSAFRIDTTHTSITGVSAANARAVNLVIF